jgi:hypothetical protein
MPAPGTWEEAAPIVGAEAVLAGGLIVAACNRRRLLELEAALCRVPATGPIRHGSGAPHFRGVARRRPG